MIRDITLGQYFPGNTIAHRLDPRSKLIVVLLFIVALFLAKSYVSYGLMTAVVIACVAISRIKLKTVLRNLKPLILIFVITAFVNLFYTEGDVLVQFWVFKITMQGVIRACQMLLRISLLITGTFLLTYTTSPLALTDGMESLLSPLKKIHLPVHELAMMMSIALRFIPTLVEETDKIMSAQKARGANFDTGKFTEKAKALLPLLVPLFVSASRRADELAVAMECRCYHGGEGRTRMKVLTLHTRDGVVLLLGVVLLAGMIVLRSFGL
ncbi:MAG: energy-coupling factor transporter transmembrane protein EcfT [Oscillospiraceae bacterium]|nr:energy-coupling factor transporter transmembrane protein EcfT [Oscillospiraceae bacterium]